MHDLAAGAVGETLGELGDACRARPPRRAWSARGRPPPGRSGPNAVARSRRASPMRCGDSKNTSVRVSDARARSAGSLPLRGRNPSNANRSVGRPLTASAMSTALGPGRAETVTPGRDRGLHQDEAGVAHGRHAGIRQHQQVGVAGELDELGGAVALVVLVQRDEARAVLDPEGAQQLHGRAGVLGGDHLGVRRAPRSAGATRRRGCRSASPREGARRPVCRAS